MGKMKKEATAILFIAILVAVYSSSTNVFADEVGCCSNPGAGLLACSSERLSLRDKECCPNQASFPGYYKSQQNPSNPSDYSDCITNFFSANTACSAVDACALGCCCSQLGSTITSGAQCQGTGLTFFKGQTDCNQVCPPPQCNLLTGCGNVTQAADCNNPNYIPKLSSLAITPIKGQKQFMLQWQDECSQTAVSYDVMRCIGAACTNFAAVGTTNTNSFQDSSSELLFDTAYTYQIRARYSLQAATPTIAKTASLGNAECNGRLTNDVFCLSNTAYSCDSLNSLVQKSPPCAQSQVCIVDNNQPLCMDRVSCNYNAANPFGLFYTQQDCETNKYCFYDRSFSTVDSCFGCDPSMACYDYKTEGACARDNCKIGGCEWKSISSQIGIGVCVSTTSYNCQWCESHGTSSLGNLRSFNNVFDFCTQQKSDALSEGAFKCYFSNGKSKNCNDVVCTDYDTSQCSSSAILHDENNRVINPSQDECGIGVCQNINNACVKNADGDNIADCTTPACEKDFFPPNTTLLPIIRKGVVDSLVVQIYDRTNSNSSAILKTSPDYTTFLCVEPCSERHPYNASTSSKAIIISNLNAFDGLNGNKLLTFNEGTNTIRYYSEDPAKNIEEVKEVTIETHGNTDGPRVFAVNVSDSSNVLGKFFTSNQKPVITVSFVEPAIVTFARLVNKNTGAVFAFPPTTQLDDKAAFSVNVMLGSGEYNFEMNAKNKDNIFMRQPLSQAIVIDNSKPMLSISPLNGTVINTSAITISLTLDKEVNINSISINSQDVKGLLSTTNNKVFTAAINLSDGNKDIEVAASDFAGNQVAGSSLFVVYTHQNTISLASPKFGTSQAYIFDIVAQTDNNAVCRYSLDDNFEYEFMDGFTSSGGTTHTISGFSRIASGDTSTHKLYIKCKDSQGISFNSFDLNVDTFPPLLTNEFAYPNPVIEKPSNTTLNVQSDKPTICKFSSSSKDFSSMEGKFNGFDNSIFSTINKQAVTLPSEGSYLYYVACQSKSGLVSETEEIPLKVDLSIPMSITSHTPEFFNSTNAVLAVETNKIAQCKFSETDSSAQNGEIFGAPSYSHTRQLISAPGKHTFYIVCKDQYLQKFSDVAAVSFVVDTTPPTMLYVDDSSTFGQFPEKTCLTDRLRVKFLGEDNESNVKDYFYLLISKIAGKQIFNYMQSLVGGEWLWVQNLSLEDNAEYFFRVKARNWAGMESAPMDSTGITVDTSACKQQATCGDGIINQPGEQCDKDTFGSINSCTQYTNFAGGTLKCNSNCQLDTSACTESPKCGNNQLDSGEACDGSIFGKIKTCSDYSPAFSGGTLKCNSNCQLDTSACTESPKCGNGKVDAGEACDKANLGPLSGKCIDYNPSTFSGGTLKCNSNCQLDTSACEGTHGACGDGKIDIGEACDSNIFGAIKTCSDYSPAFSGGTLKCNSNCQLDTSACTESPKCGNGKVDAGESCDTNFLGLPSSKCIDYSTDFNSGDIKCANDCKLDTSACTEKPKCGNGKLDTGELCDGDNFGSLIDLRCSSYSPAFINGTLACRNCQISTDNCVSNQTAVLISCKDKGDCKLNEPCSDNSDCESRYCSNGKCAQPTCNDGVKNQAESDIDCGGSCGATCANGNQCNSNSDCRSNFCSFGFCKQQESCSDGKLSPGESDVDCGGHCPAKCPEDSSCNADADCGDGLQCTESKCKKGLSETKQKCTVDGLVSSMCDNIPDEWKIQNGLDLNDPNVANEDPDKDGLTNLQEYNVRKIWGNSTNPNSADTDKDGYTDKEELDAGTNPLDPKSHPKPNLIKIIGFAFGALAFLAAFVYLSYRMVQKRKGQKFELPQQRATQRMAPQQQQQKQAQPRQAEEAAKIREAIKKKEELKEMERRRLFEPFGVAKKPEQKELKEGMKQEEPKKELGKGHKPAPKRGKQQDKKSKEDVFVKLREISKGTKNISKSKRKNAQK